MAPGLERAAHRQDADREQPTALGKLHPVRGVRYTNVDRVQRHGGTRHADIRDFRFENSLTQVSILERDLANRLFKLIHEKDDANGKIAATVEYEEEEDALDEFCGRAGKLYGDAILIYNDIAGDLRWPRDAFSERANNLMRSEYERLCAHEGQRAAFNDDLFEEFGDAVPVST